jgi:MFS family permease
VAGRAAQGIGAALAAPGVLALLTTSAPDEAARNRALALFGAVTSGGMSVGLLLGGLLTDIGSWRWTLFINVPIGAVVLLLTRRLLSETPRRPGRFDVVGAVTATLGAVSVVWSLIGAPEHGWTSARTVGGLVLGGASLMALAITERRVSHPLLRPALLRDRRRVGSLGVMTLIVGAQFSMFFLVVQYLQRELGFGPLSSGFAFLPLSVGIFAMSRVTPRLVARFGQVPLLMIGTAGMAASFAWFSTMSAGQGYAAAILGPMLLNGISAGLTFMPVTSLVLSGVEPEHAGSASGLLQTAQQLGGAVGLAVIVSVYAANDRPGEFLPGTTEAFLTSSLFALVAFAIAVAVVRRPRPVAEPAPEAEVEEVLEAA